jgi:hypothetical protein
MCERGAGLDQSRPVGLLSTAQGHVYGELCRYHYSGRNGLGLADPQYAFQIGRTEVQ